MDGAFEDYPAKLALLGAPEYALVDLDHIEVEHEDRAHIGIAGAVVVHGEVEAVVLERLYHLAEHLVIAGGDRLGDLEVYHILVDIVLLGDIVDMLDEAGLHTFDDREVDVDALNAERGGDSAFYKGTDLTQHEVVDIVDKSVLLGYGNELVGEDIAEEAVVEPYQRLGTVELTVGEGIGGLIIDLKAALLEAAGEGVFDSCPAHKVIEVAAGEYLLIEICGNGAVGHIEGIVCGFYALGSGGGHDHCIEQQLVFSEMPGMVEAAADYLGYFHTAGGFAVGLGKDKGTGVGIIDAVAGDESSQKGSHYGGQDIGVLEISGTLEQLEISDLDADDAYGALIEDIGCQVCLERLAVIDAGVDVDAVVLAFDRGHNAEQREGFSEKLAFEIHIHELKDDSGYDYDEEIDQCKAALGGQGVP